MSTSARKREDRLANLTPELPAYSSSIRGEDPHADTIHLVRTLGGVRTRLFVPLVDPCIRKGGDPRGAALERLASSQRGLREMTSAALILLVMGREGFEPVWHSRIPYYESKPGGSGTLSTGFALPRAHQENGFSSQPVCVRIFLDPSSALSPRLATSSPNSTGSACLNSKEYRAFYSQHAHS